MRTKQSTTVSMLLSALAFGVAASVGAQTVVVQPAPQTVVVQPAPDTLPPPSDSQTLIVVPPTATPVPDPAADTKCRNVIPAEYWDCVNSHNGGQ